MVMNWKEINTHADIDGLMEAVAGFHDSCIVSVSYTSGAFVSEEKQMHMSLKPEGHVLKMILQSQLNIPAIELCFTGIRRLALAAWQDNYGAEILGGYLAFHDAIMPGDPPRVIVWSNDDWFDPAKLGEYIAGGDPGTTYIISKSLRNGGLWNSSMRQYLCECTACGKNVQINFEEPYPALGAVFPYLCDICGKDTGHTRVMTRKARAELRAAAEEEELRGRIRDRCAMYGFQTRPLYQSIVIISPRAEWSFDYHPAKKTLYHESSYPFNIATGDPAKAHVQFRDRKMSIEEIIDYIARHDGCDKRKDV